MRSLQPGEIATFWQQVLVAQNSGEPMEVCTEGFTWIKPNKGALTELEAMIQLSFRVVGPDMTLYFVPSDGADERVVRLEDGEGVLILELVVMLADFGVIPAPFNGGTRSDFIMRVDYTGRVYLLSPGTLPTISDKPLDADKLFLAERLLNFIEVC